MSSQEISIATAADLLASLRHRDPRVRAAILQASAQQPEKVQDLAAREGVDLFGELFALRKEATESQLRPYYVQALLSMNDMRADDLATEEFLTTDNSNVILLTARKLSGLPADERIDLFGPVIMTAANQTRTRAAANLLADCQNLPVQLGIRVAASSDHQVDIAPLSQSTLKEWVAELQGPYPRRTRQILLAKDDGSFETLVESWHQLPLQIKQWALSEVVQQYMDANKAWLIRKVLCEENDSQLLVEAIKASVDDLPDKDRMTLLTKYLNHSHPDVRAAAVSYGQLVFDAKGMYEEEPDLRVKVALLSYLSQEMMAENIEFIALQLGDSHWKIRSAASFALASMAPDSMPVIVELLNSDVMTIKAGAIQAMKRLKPAY